MKTASPTTTTSFEALFDLAEAAGRQAADNATVVPMVVGTAKGLFDDSFDTTKPTYFVEGGVCGFAWVKFKGNTAFGRWAKKNGKARPAYGGGLQVWVSGYQQSMQRKAAYAQAFAGVLNEAGVTAYAESRMD